MKKENQRRDRRENKKNREERSPGTFLALGTLFLHSASNRIFVGGGDVGVYVFSLESVRDLGAEDVVELLRFHGCAECFLFAFGKQFFDAENGCTRGGRGGRGWEWNPNPMV